MQLSGYSAGNVYFKGLSELPSDIKRFINLNLPLYMVHVELPDHPYAFANVAVLGNFESKKKLSINWAYEEPIKFIGIKTKKIYKNISLLIAEDFIQKGDFIDV